MKRLIRFGRVGLLASLFVSISFAAFSTPAESRKVKIEVVPTLDPPNRVDLQGNDFGTKTFLRSGNRFSLEHDFVNARPARVVIAYDSASTAFSVRPLASSSAIAINLNVRNGQNCDLSIVQRMEQRANSDDYQVVMSAAVQSALIVAGGTCDSAFTRRLEIVQVDARCQLSRLVDAFDMASYRHAGLEQRISQCVTSLAKALLPKLSAKFDAKMRLGKFAEAAEIYEDLSSIVQDDDWSIALQSLPNQTEKFKEIKSEYLITQFIASQNSGAFSEAADFRSQIQALMADPRYDAAFDAAEYSEVTLNEILGQTDVGAEAMEVADTPDTVSETEMLPG